MLGRDCFKDYSVYEKDIIADEWLVQMIVKILARLTDGTSFGGIVVESFFQYSVDHCLGHVGCGAIVPIRKQCVETARLE